jgi:glycosyltransferase involved in cell wall biosynthesis
MKVLMLHNRYRQPGGEDAVFEAEYRLLRRNGVEAVREVVDNAPPESHRLTVLRTAADSAWSHRSYDWVRRLCQEHQPDIVHVHNFWMQLTPSVHAAARACGAATVQTLHNFRLLCAGSVFLRDGRVCEDCLGRSVWRGVLHRCYRESAPASAAVVRMIQHNRARRTWNEDVDAFIVLTEFGRSKFAAGGLPVERIHIKPNFIEDPGPSAQPPSASDYFVFAGRLSREKGVDSLIEAWIRYDLGRSSRLLVVGDGPQRSALQHAVTRAGVPVNSVHFAGWKTPEEVRALLAESRGVIIPSICYEGLPTALIEGFARGRPVIASRLGPLEALVHDRGTGRLFPAGDSAALAACVRELSDGELANRLGRAARQRYEETFTAERNFSLLLDVYRSALKRRLAEVSAARSTPQEVVT